MTGRRLTSRGSRTGVPVGGFGAMFTRGLLIGVAGGTVGLVALGLSRTDGQLLSAGFFVLALYVIPVTAGLVIAAVFEARSQAPRMPRRFRTMAFDRCGLCNRRRAPIGGVWVCPVCDGAPI